MVQMTFADIERDASDLVKAIASGEPVSIVRDGKPIAEVRPARTFRPRQEETETHRPAGLWSGQFVVPDDFDDPLPDDVWKESTGKRQRPFGLSHGEFVVTDDFDDPLPKEIVEAFYGR